MKNNALSKKIYTNLCAHHCFPSALEPFLVIPSLLSKSPPGFTFLRHTSFQLISYSRSPFLVLQRLALRRQSQDLPFFNRLAQKSVIALGSRSSYSAPLELFLPTHLSRKFWHKVRGWVVWKSRRKDSSCP